MQIIIGAIGAVFAALVAFGYVQTWRLHSTQADVKQLQTTIDTFKLAVEAEQKEKKAKLGEANVKYETATTELNAAIDKLRKQSKSTSSFLPNRSSTVPSSKNICFDRAEFDKAQSDSEREIEEFVIEGTKTAIDLECGVNWAN